jgi:hypothetical protein
MPGIAGVGLDPIPTGTHDFEGAATEQSIVNPRRPQEPGQPKPVGPASQTTAGPGSDPIH